MKKNRGLTGLGIPFGSEQDAAESAMMEHNVEGNKERYLSGNICLDRMGLPSIELEFHRIPLKKKTNEDNKWRIFFRNFKLEVLA